MVGLTRLRRWASGDRAGAVLELEVARQAFERLGLTER